MCAQLVFNDTWHHHHPPEAGKGGGDGVPMCRVQHGVARHWMLMRACFFLPPVPQRSRRPPKHLPFSRCAGPLNSNPHGVAVGAPRSAWECLGAYGSDFERLEAPSSTSVRLEAPRSATGAAQAASKRLGPGPLESQWGINEHLWNIQEIHGNRWGSMKKHV